MTLALAIILIIISLFLIVLEVLVIPGGVVGVIALGLMAVGIYSIYEAEGTTVGHIALGATIVAIVAVVYFTLKSGAWNKIALHSVIDGKTNVIDPNLLKVGDIGVAISDIRPMGNALFGDEKYEVSSEGDKIPVHSRVEIIKIEGNKIYVIKTN